MKWNRAVALLVVFSLIVSALSLLSIAQSGESSDDAKKAKSYASWSSDVTVYSTSGVQYRDCDIARGANYLYAFADEFKSSGKVYVKRSTDGTSWSAATTVLSGLAFPAGGFCVYTIGGKDNIIVSSLGNVKKSVDNGTTFSSLTSLGSSLNNTEVATNASMDASRPYDSDIYVAGTIGTSGIYLKKSTNAGSSWSPSYTVINSPATCPVLMRDDTKLYCFYRYDLSSEFNVYAKNSSDWGKTWGSPTKIYTKTQYAATPCNAQNIDSQRCLLTISDRASSTYSNSKGIYGFFWYSNNTFQTIGYETGSSYKNSDSHGYSGIATRDSSAINWVNYSSLWCYYYSSSTSYVKTHFSHDSGLYLMPPPVEIMTPTQYSTYYAVSPSINLSGTACDADGISNIAWKNLATGASGIASGTTDWSIFGITLNPGCNFIFVNMTDMLGNKASDTITIIFDSIAPTCAIKTPATDPYFTTAESIRLYGNASDNIGVSLVKWENIATGASGTATGTTTWSTKSIALNAGNNLIYLNVSDFAGNIGTDSITIMHDSPPTLHILTPPYGLDGYHTTMSTIDFGGNASDDYGVSCITWNNTISGEYGMATGTTNWSIAGIPLNPGCNWISVTAWDTRGSTSTAEFIVMRWSSLPVPHAPIIIDGNAGFLASNESTGISWGSGTLEDPYIIEGWEIDITWGSPWFPYLGISIKNSNCYFVIRGVYVVGTYDDMDPADAIILTNVSNCVVEDCITKEANSALSSGNNNLFRNCSFTEAYVYGLCVSGSFNVVRDCISSFNFYSGIGVGGYNNTVHNNTCFRNYGEAGGSGILVGGSYNTISNNFCSHQEYSDNCCIDVDGNNNRVANNTCTDSRDGISVGGTYNIVVDNNCSDNFISGIEFAGNYNTISKNTCYGNGIGIGHSEPFNGGSYPHHNSITQNNLICNNAGISMDTYLVLSPNYFIDNLCERNVYGAYIYSWNTVLINNTFSNNSDYGVYIHGDIYGDISHNNNIWNNSFYCNNGAGYTYDPAHPQAYDDGISNRWNSTDGYGNFWSDWTTPDSLFPWGIVDNPYQIAGSAGAKDCYPLTGGPVIWRTSHKPIYISSNAQFAYRASVEGWTGNGSADNPYIIRGYDINASYDNGIFIKNTNSHFIIRNVQTFTINHAGKGIYLNNVSNGRIENCTCTDNLYGILVSLSSNIEISDCTVSSSSGNGLYVLVCSNVLIEDCDVISNGNYGVHLGGCNGVTMTNTDVSSNAWNGIYMKSCANVSIAGGRCSYNLWNGINAVYCNTTVIGGNCSSNGLNGIYAYLCPGIILSSAVCIDNVQRGAYLISCNAARVEDCAIDSNHQIGLHIASCNDANVSGGSVSSNAWNGLYARLCNNLVIFCCDADSNGMYGMYLSGCTASQVKGGGGGRAIDNMKSGIGLAVCNGIAVSQMTATGNHHYGIRYDTSTAVTITGCTLTGNTFGPTYP